MMRSLVLAWVSSLMLAAAAVAQSAPGLPQGAPRPGAPTAGAPTPGPQRPALPTRDNVQRPQTGTAKIRGRVVASGTGVPLRRAQITLTGLENQLRRVSTTDADGRYEITDLPAGRFSLNASKGGYVALQYGQRRPFEGGTPLVVSDGQDVASIDFSLPRGAVISGRVVDEFGEPMAQAQVQAQRFQYQPDGQRRLVTARSDTTDDRGEFRIFGLMPGEYVVSAGVRSNVTVINNGVISTDAPDGYPPTFYPGTLSAIEAQPVGVGIAEEQSVQFALIASRLVRIAGSVLDSEGRPFAGAEVMAMPRDLGMLTSLGINTTGGDGRFTISGVAPGEYSLQVRSSSLAQAIGAARSTVPEGGMFPISVGNVDLLDLRLTTSRGALVTGKVTWDGTSPRTGQMPANALPLVPRVFATAVDPTRPGISISTPTDSANGSVDDDGNFQLGGVMGQVLFTMNTPTGWTIRSVTLDGRDISDTPIDIGGRTALDGLRITLTDKLTNVGGQVSDASGKPARDYVVVLLPLEDRDPLVTARFVRLVRPNTNGRFEVRGVRPGRYAAVALESLEQGRQYAPEFQKELRKGAREFALREGETLSLDLKLTPDL